MKGKLVFLKMKGDRGGKYYPSVSALCKENGKETINIGLNALWNALSKNGGVFTNRFCSVKYVHYDTERKEWK